MSDNQAAQFLQIYRAIQASNDPKRCCVAPSPEIAAKLRQALDRAREGLPRNLASLVGITPNTRVGFNDGLNIPGHRLPFGAPSMAARNLTLERTQLSGTLRVIVVLVDFADKPFVNPAALKKRFHDLFFSSNVVPTGSVYEYYREVTDKKVKITGDVAGPFRLPLTMANYANGESGTGNIAPNARTMALDAAKAADPIVDFKPYDNDGDGYVEAFIVVHAGRGAEETGDGSDIWSHKWVLSGDAFPVDGASLYAYLTIPEDAKLGVCAHELGHLLFGFPDLYDTSDRSEGVGNWCLMGGGSWLGAGNTPAHPSAWCKSKQGWVTVTNVTNNGVRTISDVKASKEVLRLWRRGAQSDEYFLVENRGRSGFDKDLPGEGLLIWRIDDTINDNTNALHPKVAVLQADGKRNLEGRVNRGDDGDPYPGASKATKWGATTNPSSVSYGGIDTEVSLSNIDLSRGKVTADISVSAVRKSKAAVEKPRRAKTRPRRGVRAAKANSRTGRRKR